MTSPDLLEKLAAYVPEPVVRAIYRQPRSLTKPLARRFPAAVLFSDISGFTRLSEILNQAGPTGAEELTAIINQYFTQMIQIVREHHGQVVKFSGDAMTVLFPAEEVSLQVAIRQAGECALAMQQQMQDLTYIETTQGNTALSMTVGIGAGEILECSIGGVLGRWEYVVGGDPLAQVAMAERKTSPSEVMLSPQAWAEVGQFFRGNPVDDGFVKLEETRIYLTKTPVSQLDWGQLSWENRQLAEQALQCYIPGAIKARLDKQSEWLAELRRMTILFIGIGGFDYEAENAGEQLQNFLQATQELIYRFEGSLGKVAVDDKGTVLLILFGAPPFSHEDDSRRAVACALTLQTVARTQNLRMAIGISEGSIFAGPVGAPSRREYTVIGDEVNLAARLMQLGRAGTTLVTTKVRERAGPHFIIEDLGQRSLKGKAQPVPVFQVKGEQGTQDEFVSRYLSYEDPLIGCKAELAQIRASAEAAHTGNLQLLFIEGELGLGKSRLAAEMVREWMMQGGVGYGSKCISYSRKTSYQAWREILSTIFGLNPSLEAHRQLARLAGRVAELNDPPDQPNYWADRLPLLADVLGLDAPENDFTRHITGELRRDNTFALIEAILRSQVKRHPLLILLEDIHWADELSLALTSYLAQKLLDCSLFLVLVYRPMSPIDFAPLLPLIDLPHTHTVQLTPLTPQESHALVSYLIGDKTLPPQTVDILLSRGQGNPFFLQEVTGAILNLLNTQEQTGLKLPGMLDLPDTVQDVILSRVDKLSESEKLTLKIASVIGTSFQRLLLTAVHPMNGAQYLLPAQLDKLESEKLLRLEAPAPKWEYVFRNVITQEVVYEGLLMAQRRQLHTTVGSVLEETMPEEIERLAFHYSRSNNLEKALYYLKNASQKAQREYANRAAIDYYSETLAFITERAAHEKDISIISPEYWDALLERAKLYNLIGQREDEIEDLGTLGIIAEALNDDRRRSLAAKQWAHLYETAGNYEAGLELIERSGQLAYQANDEKLVAEGYNQWGKLLYLRGEYATAYQHLQNALQIGQKHQDKNIQAEALNSLGVVAHYQTDYEVALYFFEEANELWQMMNNQVGLGKSISNLGAVYYDMGQYTPALRCFKQSLALYQQIGDRSGEALTRHNLGRVHRSLGDYEKSRELFENALTTYQSIGDPRREAYTLCQLGFLYCRIQDHKTALTFLDEAGAILKDLNDPWELGNLFTYYGWVFTEQGEFQKAKKYFEDALHIEKQLQQEAAAIEDTAHLANIAFNSHNLVEAEIYAQQVINFISSQGVQGTEHPVKIYVICYDILKAVKKEDAADKLLELGSKYLTKQLEQITDGTLRQHYRKISENQQLLDLGPPSRQT
jgi:class 3 adenylate cyclase/predicted ATPase